jgi:hypothetical protein
MGNRYEEHTLAFLSSLARSAHHVVADELIGDWRDIRKIQHSWVEKLTVARDKASFECWDMLAEFLDDVESGGGQNRGDGTKIEHTGAWRAIFRCQYRHSSQA